MHLPEYSFSCVSAQLYPIFSHVHASLRAECLMRVSRMNLTVHSTGILGDVKLNGPGRVYVHESLPLLEGNCQSPVELCKTAL